jgi:HK97 family phage major capsid protein
MGRFGFSVQEFEELGKAIGTSLREQLEKNSLKSHETDINKMIDDKVREILKASVSGGSVPFMMATPNMNPMDIFDIQKRLEEPAGGVEINKQLQEWNDDLYTMMVCLRKQHPTQLSSYKNFETRWSALAKALNTQTAGSGLEWIPTGYSSSMIEMIEIEAVVASLFESFSMPTTTYIYPVKLSHGTAYLGGEATTDSPSMYKASTMRTSDLSFTAKKIVANYPVTEEMTEDSIVPVLPVLKRDIAQAVARAEDNAIINGDTSTTHLDTGYNVASDDARRAWMGLRRMCSDANSALGLKNDGSTWSTSAGLALLRALVAEMGVYGIKASNLALLINTNMYNKFKSLDQVSTVDKFGTAATVKNGELAGVDGILFTLSEFVEEQQNDSGIYDGTTLTDTQFLVVHKPSFRRGIRRELKLDYVTKPLYGMDYLVATTRRIWKCIYDTTTEEVVGWEYNIAK